MATILAAYAALSSASPRSDVQDLLSTIITAPPFTFDRSSRAALIKSLLQDLKSCGPKARLTAKDAAQALLAIKTLARDPAGSEVLASPTNLSTLLSLSSTFKDDLDASSEALRCLANTLLLIEPARRAFLGKEVNGVDVCLTVLERSTSPDQIFILSRVLFLATASVDEYLTTIIDGKYHGRTVVEIIASKLDLVSVAILAGTKMAREAMSDLLKFTFNLLLHYPKLVQTEPQTPEALEEGEKVAGDFWSPKLDGLLPPLLRVFNALPPTFPSPIAPPLTHVIHALITIPVNSSTRPLWFGITSSTRSSSPKLSISPSPKDSSASQSRCHSPTPSPPSPSSVKPSTLDRALSVLSAGRRSLSRSPSSNTSTNVLPRACDLLEVALAHYFPGNVEPDDAEVRATFKKENPDSALDDTLPPLLLLITKLCMGDEASRAHVRNWLVPEDLDRTSALEARSDSLGRLLRLLACVYHPRLKDAAGELLYAMSDSNATTLSALVGYGNVAGFLFHKGILSAPQQPGGPSNVSLTTPSGAAINPVTGTVMEPKSEAPEMSEEEKEQEMEKLFVLFNRLERTGALPPDQNPLRKAIQEGKLGNS